MKKDSNLEPFLIPNYCNIPTNKVQLPNPSINHPKSFITLYNIGFGDVIYSFYIRKTYKVLTKLLNITQRFLIIPTFLLNRTIKFTSISKLFKQYFF